MSLKILGFDVSKAATGVAFFDGILDPNSLTVIKFENSTDWARDISDVIDCWSPDIIVFSETVNRMCSHSTKRALFGLMFLLEYVAYKKGIQVMPINDSAAKGLIGVKFRKRVEIKAATVKWAFDSFGIEMTDDEADACSFCNYINKTCIK